VFDNKLRLLAVYLRSTWEQNAILRQQQQLVSSTSLFVSADWQSLAMCARFERTLTSRELFISLRVSAAVIIGRITGLARLFVRPSVRPAGLSVRLLKKSRTRMHGTRAKLPVPVSGTRNLGGELGSCAMGL